MRGLKLLITLLLVVTPFFLISQENSREIVDWGDETTWKDNAANGNWNADNWYNITKGWDNHNPNYEGGRRLIFDNNHQLTMTNDFSGVGTNRWQIIFTSNASNSRTITGNVSNTFFDNGGTKPKIENLSSANHTISFPITIGYNPLELIPTNGNLTFSEEIVMGTNFIDIYGNNGNTLSLQGNISGSGGIAIKQNSTVVIVGNKSYSGSTIIEAGTLELQGSIASSAVTVQSGGTLRINGDNVTFASLTVDAGGTVEIEVGKSLTVSGAFSNSGTFTIKSDATGTGSLITNGIVSGDVTIQRYVAGDWSTNNSGWHLISSPVAVQPIVDFTTTGGGNGYDFYGYNEATNTWMNYKAAGFEAWNGSANFAIGRGYSISYQATQIGKAFEGTLNNSNVTHTNLSLTAGQGEGWHLVGNPFASAIDWSNVNWVKTGFNAYAKVWQGSSYKDVTDDYSNIIPSANGFWVKASNATNTLTIPTQARTHNALNWLKSSAPIGYIILTANDTENNMSQECIIRLKDEATDGFDESFDAPFMAGNAPQIYTTVENRNLSLNSVPSYSNKTFEMGFVKNSASAFTIQLNMDNIPEGEVITLTDKKLNQSFELTKGLTYEFISEAGDDPNRFLLHFGAVGVDEAVPTTAVSAYVHNNTLYLLNASGKVQVDVMDISGRLVHSQSLQTTGLSSTPLSLPAGVYVVRLNDGQTSRTDKVIVQ